MTGNNRPTAHTSVVLREEFDDWAILFDPDTNVTFGINPMGVCIWKFLNGKHTINDILNELKKSFDDIPADAETHITDFINDLVKRGLASNNFNRE